MSIHRSALGLLLIAALLAACATDRTSVNTSHQTSDPRWSRIDSLSDIGQYATALELSDEVRVEAMAQSDWRTEFRAWMYILRSKAYTGGERKESIRALEERTTSAPVPLKQLLHSVVAELWWNYYQEERWQVMERTELASAAGSDPDTWTQKQFMERVIAEYQASLEPYDTLSRIAVGELGVLLSDDGSARALRSTVYDVLAHRALAVFRNPETRITEPAWRFSLDDPKHFDLFEPFVFRELSHRDSTAWEFQALRIHQRLERLHLNRDPIDGLVDATLQRLAFVQAQSALPNKDSLYLQSLETLRSRLPNDSCWAEVTVAIAQWHADQGNKFDRLARDAWKWERRTAMELCDAALTRWPSSFGARQAEALKARLLMPAIRVQGEQAVLPGVGFPIALTYTNTKQVWLRVVADDRELNPIRTEQEERDTRLLSQKALKSWSVTLPDDGDLNEHLVEIPVEGLPFGRYTVLVSTAPTFTKAVDHIAYCSVWSTGLAAVQRSEGGDADLLVVDRNSGAPKSGVQATAFLRDLEQGQGRNYVPLATYATDGEGRIRAMVPAKRGQLCWELREGEDIYRTGVQWLYDRESSIPQERRRTFLFTDRAIYRPGQELFFKGIMVSQLARSPKVLAAQKVTVILCDANGEQVDSLVLTSDAYGAFHGTFQLPQGGLTGGMHLETADGAVYFRVEEYKRPTFELVFDPVSTTPKLDAQASVSGVAKSYAGVPLDGAQVKWTVKRGARMPWWCGWGWRGLPWDQETEIASGTAECDGEGRFTVNFIAQADRGFPRDADPTFFYTVEAEATDINGETQQGSTSLNVGYRSINIHIGGGDTWDRERVRELVIGVENLNGEVVDLPVDVRIVELEVPGDAPVRERLWERPDRALDGSLIPTRTDDLQSWAERSTWMERTGHQGERQPLSLTGIADRPVGLYRIDVSARDPEGTVVKASKLVTLYDTAIQNTGFVHKAFHVEAVKVRSEPGEKALLLLSSALPEARVLMEVERQGEIVVSGWFTLLKGQRLVELPVMEADRGGFAVHFVCVERGIAHTLTRPIDVPWSNKDLQVEWMSFRDKLLPGAKEEWRLKITGPKKERVAAQLLSVLYDASLDHFVPHGWDMNIWTDNPVERSWGRTEPFGLGEQQLVWRPYEEVTMVTRNYPELKTFGILEVDGRFYRYRSFRGARAMNGDRKEEMIFSAAAPREDDMEKEEVVEATVGPIDATNPSTGTIVRSDFRETAFFLPDQLTDRDGSIVLRFTMPDALTRWNFMGLAHTKDLQLVRFDRQTITQKPLMVVPNLPRFLRQGDRITITAKINLVEGGTLTGKARMELFDPRTNMAMNTAFQLTRPLVDFTAAPGRSANVSWTVRVPENGEAVAMRIIAQSAGISDGEERVLPILTDRILVTESLPIAITKAGTKTFELKKLLGQGQDASTTRRNHRLQLEFTPNPAWYAVQALPYLMEFPHECAEQIFSRYYANRIAAQIVKERPQIRQVFEAWSKGSPGNEGAFVSALEKNSELKGIALEETPWLLSARDEGERKRRMALFFDLQRMASEEEVSLKKLGEMQLGSGAWGWWSGMQPSRWITQHIVAGFGRMQQLEAFDRAAGSDAGRMVKRAIIWLDHEVEREHQHRLRGTKADSLPDPSALDIHYLFARSQFPYEELDRKPASAAAFILERAQRNWLNYGLAEQAMIALAVHRMVPPSIIPTLIMQSLSERAATNEELGMFWIGQRAGYGWNEQPTELHALMIEAFQQVAEDDEKVNVLRQYLLTLKRTTDWGTTKATADACYALLVSGDDWLEPKDSPVIRVGAAEVKPGKIEAGTGYYMQSWSGEEVKSAMGKVSATTTSDGVHWGALHWQYFEQLDKVTPHESPFRINKQVMLHEQTDAGARLTALEEARTLKPGDRITIRVELRTDRYLDFVHLKDLRAAGLEPVDALSGYQWQGGLGYYRSIRDAGMHFFFDRIAPGTYVLEYDLRVTHQGDFSNGITTAQCMYAPEFGSHSEGVRVKVEE
jgi:hypothetical protein